MRKINRQSLASYNSAILSLVRWYPEKKKYVHTCIWRTDNSSHAYRMHGELLSRCQVQVRQDSFVFTYDAYLAATAIRWWSVLWRRHNIVIFFYRSRVSSRLFAFNSIAETPLIRSWLRCYSLRIVADWFNTLNCRWELHAT